MSLDFMTPPFGAVRVARWHFYSVSGELDSHRGGVQTAAPSSSRSHGGDRQGHVCSHVLSLPGPVRFSAACFSRTFVNLPTL